MIVSLWCARVPWPFVLEDGISFYWKGVPEESVALSGTGVLEISVSLYSAWDSNLDGVLEARVPLFCA